jgi:hypothetical protein
MAISMYVTSLTMFRRASDAVLRFDECKAPKAGCLVGINNALQSGFLKDHPDMVVVANRVTAGTCKKSLIR